MIGASRETVSRAMRDFQERGLIDVQHRQITITDRTQLEGMAQAHA
jgi:CRP-like cAMP-binding protein